MKFSDFINYNTKYNSMPKSIRQRKIFLKNVIKFYLHLNAIHKQMSKDISFFRQDVIFISQFWQRIGKAAINDAAVF